MGSINPQNNKNNNNRQRRFNRIYAYCHYSYASFTYSMYCFLGASLSPITDVLQSELNITSSGVGLISAIFYLTYIIFQTPVGMILQHYSHHIFLLITCLLFSTSILLFGFIDSFGAAVIIRLLAGMFAAPGWIMVITIIGDSFGNNQVSLLSGFTTSFAFIFALCMITLQGFLYEKYESWRELFYVVSVMGLINCIGIALTMYSETVTTKQDLKKANQSWMLLFTENAKSPRSPRYIPKMPTSHTFQYPQTTNSKEMKQNTCGKLKIVVCNYLNWCVGFVGFGCFIIVTGIFGLWLVPYLMLKFNYSRSFSSFLAGLGMASCGFGGLVFGYLCTRFKKRKLYVLIGDMCLGTLLFLVYLDSDCLNEYVIALIIFVSGSGTGTFTIQFALIREYNAFHECEEVATGFTNTMAASAGLFGPYICGFLIDYHWKLRFENSDGYVVNENDNTRTYDISDFEFAFSCIIPTCVGIAILGTMLIKETHGRNLVY